MKFDVIIGNPPYQLSDGGFGTSATPIYHMFVEQAKKLNPRFLSMIIPARWFAGGKGMDGFRSEMLNDNRLTQLHDYPDASDCFPGVQIKGGICYFLWDRDNPNECNVTTYDKGKVTSSTTRPLLEKDCNIFIRYNQAISILNKLKAFDETSIKCKVSSRKPFGLPTTFKGSNSKNIGDVTLFQNGGIGYISREKIDKKKNLIHKHKVFIPRAGSGSDSFPHPILGRPFYGGPHTACTETYLILSETNDEKEAQNLISYVATKFFRFLVLLSKPTQDATSKVYNFVPQQDLSITWSDELLYEKYAIDEEEVAFINSMIQPMEL
ncbi:Eco57I restriction-modification methylase domain-containing protein [Emcibacteraceae bacterium]|nr:Eco57I restriction-modification methylase domain-containing protein [Emcibacteraceae bacterium]